jgi:voltage-gated potassium channel
VRPTRLRRRVFELLDVPDASDRASRAVDIFILSLIALNTIALIVETLPGVPASFGTFFRWFEGVSVGVFTVEYLARLWASVEDPRVHTPVVGRLRYAARPMMIVDLLAILPAFLPFLGLDLRFVRAFRLMRVFRVLKVARYSSALQLLGRVFVNRRADLMLTAGAILIVLVIASSALYFAEREAQPASFESIPEAMWWAVVTLTTVGYGDIVPVTALGRLLGGVVALVGVCVIAIPTGIIGAGFAEELRARGAEGVCPTCGRSGGAVASPSVRHDGD